MRKPHVPYKPECVYGVVNEKQMSVTLKDYYHTKTATRKNYKRLIANAVDNIQQK